MLMMKNNECEAKKGAEELNEPKVENAYISTLTMRDNEWWSNMQE